MYRFGLLLSKTERVILKKLSENFGMSQAGVIRQLIRQAGINFGIWSPGSDRDRERSDPNLSDD